jgi:hypothetical protein
MSAVFNSRIHKQLCHETRKAMEDKQANNNPNNNSNSLGLVE